MEITMKKYSGQQIILILLLFSCNFPCVCFAAEEGVVLSVVGRTVSSADIDTSRPIEYSRHSDDVIISLIYKKGSPVKILVFGDGAVRGEQMHTVSVVSTSGVYANVNVKHIFTAQLSESEMKGMLKSLASLFSFDLPKVKKELGESVNCWVYCPDVIVSDDAGTTTEMEINVLKYTQFSGETMRDIKKTVIWDKTDIFEAAARFPRVYALQQLKHEINDLLNFCKCMP